MLLNTIFFLFSVGIAWSKEARLNFCINEFKIQDCQIPLSFTFENLEEIFGRDPGKPPLGAAKKKQLYTTFALMHENESRFQILNVPTAFDHLDYNFFADQFSKVSLKILVLKTNDSSNPPFVFLDLEYRL